VICALEIVGLFGNNRVNLNHVEVVKKIFFDHKFTHVAFDSLMMFGYQGFQYLVEIANEDYSVYQQIVLDKFCQQRQVQVLILVPSILAHLTSQQNTYSKLMNLAALNRLGDLVEEAGGLSSIIDLIQEGNLDYIMISSVLKTTGVAGE
jgi:hypothetical protein